MWQIFGILMPYIVIGFIVGGIAGFFCSPKGKGMVGEWYVRFLIGKNKPGERYAVHDLMVTDDEGRSSQLDHVLVLPSGIYVIETKNYSGRIYGSDKQLQWTQVLAYGRVKNKLYNPVRQNATHIYRLKEKIGKDVPFYSAIVFVKGNVQYITAEGVYTPRGLVKFLKSSAETVLTPERMEEIYNLLCEIKDNKVTSNSEHIHEIEQMQENIRQNICPRCGKELVLRNGKNGSFYGCSGYPQCRFTKPQ